MNGPTSQLGDHQGGGPADACGRLFAQEDNRGHPDLNAAGVPLMTSLAKAPATRAVLEFLYEQNAISRPFILPPGIAGDLLATLREAFMATTRDPELQAEAKRMQIDVEPTTGTEVRDIVRRLYDTPAPVVAQLKRLLDRK